MIRRTLLLVICAWVLSANFGPIAANAAPCMTVTLTGTMGGRRNSMASPDPARSSATATTATIARR